jgi:molecular chaperone HtpG
VSLAQYVERMKPGQDKIYYIIGESVAAARASPYLERLTQRGLEVLLLSERIDEWVMGQMMGEVEGFPGKRFKDVARGDLELGTLESESDRNRLDEERKESKGLLKRVKDAIGDRVLEVRVSERLADSPACLVRGEHDFGAGMRRILAAAGQAVPESKPALELNVTHPLVKHLDGLGEPRFKELSLLLFEQAELAEGSQLGNPAEFVQRLNRLLVELTAAHSAS